MKKKSGIVFWDDGHTRVSFKGYSYNLDKRIYGAIDIEVPPVARELKLTGFHFPPDLDFFPLEDQEYEVGIYYYNGFEHLDYYRIINGTGLNIEDTLFFDEPILLTNIRSALDTNGEIGMSVKTLDGNIDVCGNGAHIYESYYYERNDDSGFHEHIKLNLYGSDSIPVLFLLADWMP